MQPTIVERLVRGGPYAVSRKLYDSMTRAIVWCFQNCPLPMWSQNNDLSSLIRVRDIINRPYDL